MLQYTPIGLLMDIRVLSCEVEEAHLPHFACLEGSDPSFNDAVRVLRGDSSSVSLEKCAQLTRSHSVLRHPSFSLVELLVKIGIPMWSHLDTLIFRTRVYPLTLFIYVVPRDASMITAVEDEAKRIGGKRIHKHRPDAAIRMNAKFSLKSEKAEISPNEITLKYARPPDLFEVFVENAEENIDLKLISDGDTIWQATLRQVDYSEPSGVTGSSLRVSAAYLLIPTTASTETPPRGRATGPSEQRRDGKHTGRVSMVQKDIINRGSKGLLRGMLVSLQAENPSVVSQWEVNDILQGSRVLQDQWSSLLTMLQNKGERACCIMLRVFRDLDYYLYEDLGL